MTTIMAAPAAVDGQGDPHCGAKARTGSTCKLRAGFGTDHVGWGRCKHHGGSTPSQRTAVAAQIVEHRVRTMFGKPFDDAPVGNPLDVFAELAGTVRGWMRTMQTLVEELSSPGYAALTGEQIRAEVQLFERAMDRANTVLSTYAKLNIDERLAKISEAQAFIVLQAIESALAAAGVTGSRAIEAKQAAAKRLRAGTASDTEIAATTP